MQMDKTCFNTYY